MSSRKRMISGPPAPFYAYDTGDESDRAAVVQYQREQIAYLQELQTALTGLTTAVNVLNSDYFIEVARGNVANQTIVHKFGFNPSVGTTLVDVVYRNANIAWQTTASAVEAISSSTDDDGDPTSNTGAHTVTIQGLDENYNRASETVTLNGTAASAATTTTFIRIDRAFVATAGTYHGANAGTITIRDASAGATRATIPYNATKSIGYAQSQIAHYALATGKTAIVFHKDIVVDPAKSVNVFLRVAEGISDVNTPFTPARIKMAPANISTPIGGREDSPGLITGPADIWYSAYSTSSGTGVSCGFDILIFG